MRNHIGEGVVVDLVAPTAVVGGTCYQIGDCLFIAATDAAAGKVCAFMTSGKFLMPKVTTQTFTVGQAVYWNAVSQKLTNVQGFNKKFGFTVETAASGDANVVVYFYSLSG